MREQEAAQESRSKMRVFHRTPHGAAIVKHGFRDNTGHYMTHFEYTGVFVSDLPLDGNEGAKGDDLIELEVDEDVIAPFEWVAEGKDYREWCVPPEVLNALRRRLLTPQEEEELASALWESYWGASTDKGDVACPSPR